MSLLQDILRETLRMFVLAAPFLLLGLLLAGFLHVLLPARLIRRWLGQDGLGGAAKAALIGIPLPICSCGVVPIAVEMRRKGASRPASLSFLITTPESSVDSILFTWGLLGPVMAIARPIAAFLTAMIGGVLTIAWPDEEKAPDPEHAEDGGCAHGCDERCSEDPSHALGGERADEAIAVLKSSIPRLFRRPSVSETSPDVPGVWPALLRPALRYGLVELLDDLAFWLVLGVVLAGVLGAVLPADLGERGLGGGLAPMLILLAIGIPLYMCASASTPVAAALMAKGISPGAALVFLLAGPATNAATILLLGKTFGRRFIQVYLVSVALGALLSGLALDALIAVLGWKIVAPAALTGEEGLGFLAWFSAALLAVLLAASFWRGSARQGWRELRSSLGALRPAESGASRPLGRRALIILAVLLVAAYLATGWRSVPPDSHGYGFRFGKLVARDLAPGLHYFWPEPMGRFEIRRTEYARKTDVGFKTDLDQLARRRELTMLADPDEWHTPVAAMNPDPERASYLTADENLLEMSFTIHYAVADDAAFFFQLDHQRDLVALYAETAAREIIATMPLDDALTTRRADLETAIAETLQAHLERLGSGIRVVSVHVVDVHPPAGAVFAFRDVSTAREEKETRIHRAKELAAGEVPRARGEAAVLVAEARSSAEARRVEAAGRSQSFLARAGAYGKSRDLLRHLLWLECSERALAGREKFIVPPETEGRGVTLWRGMPPSGGKQP